MAETAPGVPPRTLALARLALGWERLWPALWPAAGVAGLWAALAWMGLPAALPGWLHLLLLLVALTALGWALLRGGRGFRWPDMAAARRKLERDNDLSHRPLLTLEDRPAGVPDPVAAALWRAAQERARARIAGLTIKAPHPNLAARDPYALRAAVGLLLVVGATAGWGRLGERLADSLLPELGLSGGGRVAALDVWVTPPDYTGLPPVFLTRRDSAETADTGAAAPTAPQEVSVPVGSTVLAKVSGGRSVPTLTTGTGEPLPFEALEDGAYQIAAPVTQGDRLEIRQGRQALGSWTLKLIPDQAPGIAFRTPPQGTERFSTRIDYTAADDYGLARVSATVTLAETVPQGIDMTPIPLALPLPAAAPRQATSASFHDLSPHPWAGLRVRIRLEAADAAGQTGSSPEQDFILPERVFNHPVAKALVAERKKLTLGGDAVREPVARAVSELSARPGTYGGALSPFLAMRSLVSRLMLDREPDALAGIQQTMWDTALAIEEGGLSVAERDLRAAQKALMEAMERDSSEAEIDQLMQELQEAMQRYLDALEERARQAQELGQPLPEIPLNPNTQVLDRQDFEQMMQQMRDLARTGSKEAARQMLSQLQEMLENLRTGESAADKEAMENAARMQETMDDLQNLARRQQELMDETFREQQDQEGDSGEAEAGDDPLSQQGSSQSMPNRQRRGPQQGQGAQEGRQGQERGQGQGQAQGQDQGQGEDGSGSAAMAGQVRQQDALRKELGRLMQRFGEMGGDIPRPLGRAERAMRDAEQALSEGSAGDAVPAQRQALDQLQQSLREMAQQMQQQMSAAPGMRQGQRPQEGRLPGRDPLGRPLPGNGQGQSEDVKIPEEADVQRARQILDELRRRSGEQGRPKLERDYIDRLLERF